MTYPTKKVIKIFHAIESLNSNAHFKYNKEDISTLQWLDGTTPISNDDILAEQKRLQDIEDAK